MPPETPSIAVQAVSKTYPLFDGPGGRFRQLLWPAQAGAGVPALSDINLSIPRGQIFGIVGKNGSGKSTLLRLLTGVLQPTTGQVVCTGRVAALLELGAGFNPEFSGRDNVLITCTLLGIDDATALARLPDIEAFADIGAFFDRPVKTYSTGMYARVAFAALAVCEPDVLILDEILAVGDEAFQRKCLARLERLAAAGCTIVLVTHNSQLVVEFCQAAALLDDGKLAITGKPKEVVHEYYRRQGFAADGALPAGGFAANTVPRTTPTTPSTAEVSAWFDANLVSVSSVSYGNGEAHIDNLRINDEQGVQVNMLARGRHYCFCYRVTLKSVAQQLEFGSLIKNTKGVELGGRAVGRDPALAHCAAGSVFAVSIPFVARLLPGSYFFNAGVRAEINGAADYLHRIMDALMFRVVEEPDTGLRGIADFSIADEPAGFLQLAAETDQ